VLHLVLRGRHLHRHATHRVDRFGNFRRLLRRTLDELTGRPQLHQLSQDPDSDLAVRDPPEIQTSRYLDPSQSLLGQSTALQELQHRFRPRTRAHQTYVGRPRKQRLFDRFLVVMTLRGHHHERALVHPSCLQIKFTHNVVRKVRWANYPFVPGIRENIKTAWADKRLDAWVKTCTQCHSESFARAYLEYMDNGTYSGLDKYDEAHEIVHKQYEDGLLTGQKTNRPEPPKPVPEGFEQFFQIYWSKGNNPAAIELKLFEMAEDHLVQLHVALAHQHWGFTYTVGWAAMNRAYVEINDEDTKLKEKLALQERVAKLEQSKTSLLDFDGTDGKITLGSLGGGMLLTGTLALAGWSRRKKNRR